MPNAACTWARFLSVIAGGQTGRGAGVRDCAGSSGSVRADARRREPWRDRPAAKRPRTPHAAGVTLHVVGCQGHAEVPFPLGRSWLNGNVHSGRHEAIVDRELFEAAQSSKRSPERTNWAPTVKSCLDGLVACAHCGGGIQRDTVRGQPRFRERHGRECPTAGRSRMAAAFEDDVRTVFSALELPEHWRHDMASRAASLAGPPLEELQRKRRRLVRAFGDDATAFDEAEYELPIRRA